MEKKPKPEGFGHQEKLFRGRIFRWSKKYVSPGIEEIIALVMLQSIFNAQVTSWFSTSWSRASREMLQGISFNFFIDSKGEDSESCIKGLDYSTQLVPPLAYNLVCF